MVTASIPLDFAGYWRGVLAMDFSVSEIKAFLVSAMQGGQEGEYQLYDSHLNLLASSAPGNVLTLLSPREQELLSRAFVHDNQGGLRLLTRYISWAKLRNFDGVLLRIHTLREGVRGNFGTITIALDPDVGPLHLDAVALLAGDPPHGPQHERSANLSGVAGMARCLDSPAQSRGAFWNRRVR
ncbi:hypothetical protein MJ390_19575 [Klebsiella pneumoniae]|nr:hypothetical protein MJ390_19575 [Klebsiella pneumoniae]